VAGITPSQTIGPYFHHALAFERSDRLAAAGAQGRRIAVQGALRDGRGEPVAEGLIEIWQANAWGRYRHPDDAQDKPIDPAFDGFGRVQTEEDGSFSFETVKPGCVPGPGGAPQAPHLVLAVHARGLLQPLITRAYFEDEAGNAADPILALVPAARRPTLIARRIGEDRYRFDLFLQGPEETVFFDV
jgi:protocatechuate 3,4-dioxygenase alpha subunit